MVQNDGDEPHNYKIGNERLCRITAEAANKFKQSLSNQNRFDGALGLAVVGGGVSGLKYKIETVEGPTSQDVLVITQNVKLAIDLKSARFISGSFIDLNSKTGDFEF